MKEIFENVFGEENIESVDDNKLLIHWKELTIKNEVNETHKIYDFFALVEVNQINNIDIRFYRSTFTKKELLNGYLHSHCRKLTSIAPIIFSHACFGQGPLNELVHTKVPKDEENKKSFFYQIALNLKNFVQTESLEGGPYVRMSLLKGDATQTLISRSTNEDIIKETLPNDMIMSFKNLLLSKILTIIKKKPHLIYFNDKINYDKTNCVISNELLFNNYLDEKTFIELYNSNVLVKGYYSNALHYYKDTLDINIVNEIINTNKDNFIVFKDKVYGFKVLEKEGELEILEGSYVIYPPLFNKIFYIINNYIYTYGTKMQFKKTQRISV